MRLLQVSDLHIFADLNATLLNLNTAESFTAVLDHIQAAELSPDMLILSGDLSQDDSVTAYQYVAKHCQRFQCPIYWLPGNHDEPGVMQAALAKTQLKEDKVIFWKNWAFILLNSHYPKHVAGYLDPAELARLDYHLAQHPQQHVLVFLHHHPMPVGSKWLDTSCLINPEAFFAVIAKYSHIRGIICGHVHQVFESNWQNIPVLSAPSTCIQFLPGSEKFALDTLNPGYRWFELHDDGTFETGIERIKHFHNTADFSARGY